MNKKANRQAIILVVVGLVLVSVAILIALNLGFLKDLFIGMGYRPSEEMAEIRESLGLTSRGRMIFDASLPSLEEKESFNQYCRESENTTAVLGCYRDDKIYVYNVVSDELSGIRELTAAHELLHAVYDRMSDADKGRVRDLVSEVYLANQDVMGAEVESYSDEQRLEEMYVRVGTEIADLPSELEKHYGEIFEDQDRVVSYYNSYIGVFRKIEARMAEILAKTSALSSEISAKTIEYEQGVAELNAAVLEFNNCARTADCFASTWVFNRQRNELIARQEGLSSLYNTINELISQYNTLVVEYNDNVLHGQILNQAINSSSETSEVESR